jgi:hypothetical protein
MPPEKRKQMDERLEVHWGGQWMSLSHRQKFFALWEGIPGIQDPCLGRKKKKKKSEIPAFSFQGCPPTGQSSEEELASVDGSPWNVTAETA